MPERAKTKRIDEELVCADALIHCLKHEHNCDSVTLQREPNDPPDFWITINGTTFAAEVTSLVSGEDYRAICKILKREIGQAAAKAGHRTGKYALQVRRKPAIPRRSSAEWRRVVQQAASFICETQVRLPVFEGPPLLTDDNGDLRMVKLSEQGAAVGLVSVEGARFEAEVHGNLSRLMQDAITRKRDSLEKKGIRIRPTRTILLLYDAYGYADTEDAQKALLGVEGYDWFHSVFWAASFTDRPNELDPTNPSREGAFLFSIEPAWWTRPPTL